MATESAKRETERERFFKTNIFQGSAETFWAWGNVYNVYYYYCKYLHTYLF